ncbi:MAG: 4-(cytidine 5'-diphospho)-2-C-methyl-D-erythritol kinase [Bacteroidales bacterium]|jgi:4-diphosphocytidyl-2-C-methyl-D-erythritol kinase|nr:4-(cytidine 5'-diphospho)-2-C-methyl-D-erythritol kinase [Bacteroidales bacterium]
MIAYPLTKINIGLYITGKRADGYHNIDTAFYPTPWCDALEIVPADEFSFHSTGLAIEGAPEDNLVVRAYRLLSGRHSLPPIAIHLHKNVPTGAGLGGGSSDGATALRMLNSIFRLNLPQERIAEYALQLGSDCPFFIESKPALASGRGEILQKIPLALNGLHIAIVKPPIHSSTAEAYRHITPAQLRIPLIRLLRFPISLWPGNIINQFEPYVFSMYPEVARIKQTLYDQGALFALMSGSGASVFGLFNRNIPAISQLFPPDYAVFQGEL